MKRKQKSINGKNNKNSKVEKIKRKENVFLENHLKILNYDKTH